MREVGGSSPSSPIRPTPHPAESTATLYPCSPFARGLDGDAPHRSRDARPRSSGATPASEAVMPFRFRSSVVGTLSVLFLVACGPKNTEGEGTDVEPSPSGGRTERP